MMIDGWKVDLDWYIAQRCDPETGDTITRGIFTSRGWDRMTLDEKIAHIRKDWAERYPANGK
jgi:hypothetical protein